MDKGEIIRGVPILAFPHTVFFPQIELEWAVKPGELGELFRAAYTNRSPIGIFRAKPATRDEGSLPCERVGTIGRVSDIAFSSDAVKVEFTGHYSAELLKLTLSEPLNLADVQRREMALEVDSIDDLMDLIHEALSIAEMLNPDVRGGELAIPPDDELEFLLEALVNSIASYLPSPTNLKQTWLEEAGLNKRYALLKEEIVRLSALDDLVSKAPMPKDPELN